MSARAAPSLASCAACSAARSGGQTLRLLTTLPVATRADAEEVIRLYRLRWRIEHVYRALKSDGLALEETQVEEAGRPFKLAALGLVAAVAFSNSSMRATAPSTRPQDHGHRLAPTPGHGLRLCHRSSRPYGSRARCVNPVARRV